MKKINEWIQKLEMLRDDFLNQRARLFLYTVTHCTTVIDIYGRNGKRVFIILLECTAIQIPSSWSFDIPCIQEIENEKDLYQFVDEKAGVIIEFGHLDIRDSYPAVGELP